MKSEDICKKCKVAEYCVTRRQLEYIGKERNKDIIITRCGEYDILVKSLPKNLKTK